MAAHDAHVFESLPDSVLLQDDSAMCALRASYDDDAGVHQPLQVPKELRLSGRCVTAAVKQQDHALQGLAVQERLEEVVGKPRDHPHDKHIGYVNLLQSETSMGRLPQPPPKNLNRAPELCQRRVARRRERAQGGGARLDSSVPPEELSVEEQAHLADVGKPREDNGTQKFCLASLMGSNIGSCAPVKMTGFANCSSMNDKAEAVYAMVSVPCRMTKPSNSKYQWWTARAMEVQSAGDMSAESKIGSNSMK
eukprot:CAMPEP_0183514754 /NCGR_PEP_ID=MMETSP0371-20130417/13088_1 /TAXON_ID=268820 /ORGANISM="Peridinium aciculiferum, Strain PAER-2" /LENGTH=250 /DNA_ID=CAMNT_0025712209 /DNA_START=447 /DNA_END=1200 /DNA_ORIENTATION=+